MFLRTHLMCIGTRPEIIKMAPVYRQLKAEGQNVRVLHTGQHGAVADALFGFFDMPPDISIDLKRKSPSLAHLSVALMNGIEEAMQTLRPDVLLVQGDTSSALVGAMVGYYHDVPVAHIEAGLRTGEREPFPEEKNRELIGRLAHWHFTPTLQCTHNLLGEGVQAQHIQEVGNTVIDAALWTSERISRPDFDLLAAYPDNLRAFMQQHLTQRLILVTAHRRENWGQPIRDIAQALALTLAEQTDVVAVWPVHPNPAVRADVEAVLAGLPTTVTARICLTEPLGYQVLIALLLRCHFTLTDSGGIQEEASAFGKPVLIARQSTERQELVQVGGAVLVGTDVDAIHRHATALLTQTDAYRAMQVVRSPFGDGNTAQRIAAVLGGATPARRGASMRPLAPPVYSPQRPSHTLAAIASHV
jgi:UDP-N-acetylglucosamine 2-epimerase (non-hydrolysing)